MSQFNNDEAVPPLPTARLGLAITSLVLGILSVFLSFILLGGLLGAVGIVLSAIHLGGERHFRAMAGWGLGLSITGVLLTAVFTVVYIVLAMETFPFFGFGGYDDFMMEQDYSQWEGVRAPDMTLPTLDGEEITLSALRGKRVIIDVGGSYFWEARHIKELNALSLAGEVVVIAVSEEDPDTLRKFVADEGIVYPVVSQSGLPDPFGGAMFSAVRFFIDRNGVIQFAKSGDYDGEALVAAATADDFAGDVQEEIVAPRSGLLEGDHYFGVTEAWTLEVPEAYLISRGDWDGDGADELLMTTWDESLVVLGADGTKQATVDLPDGIDTVHLLQHASGPRLVGYSDVEGKVVAMTLDGEVIWTYKGSWFTSYVESLVAGDVDGDGNDEVLVGMMNGVHLVSEDGERLWRNRNVGMGSVGLGVASDGYGRLYASQFFNVLRLDVQGEKIGAIGMNQDYCEDILVDNTSSNGPLQVMILGDEKIFAASENGAILWTVPTFSGDDYWPDVFCASGDVEGDGITEWALVDEAGRLAIITSQGERVGHLDDQGAVESFTFLNTRGGAATLVTMEDEVLTGYHFSPTAVPAVAAIPDGSDGPEENEVEAAE